MVKALAARAPLLAAAAVFALASAGSIAWIDGPLARALHAHARDLVPYWQAGNAAVDAVSGIDLWRYFVAGMLVLAGLVAAAVPRLRVHASTLWFIAATHLACRIGGGLIKELSGRIRPNKWLETGQPVATFLAGGTSFPSGHVIYYLSLCLPFMLAWPRYRAPLLAVTVFIACARIGAELHFLSDTLAAAAWVTLVTWAMREGFARRAHGATLPGA